MQLTHPHIGARPVRRIHDQSGFTLVELMVVILIMGILFAIILPAWLNQRAKGEDTNAKAMIRTAALALETHKVDEYTYNATPAQLLAIEPGISHARQLAFSGTDDTWDISEKSASGTQFRAQRDATGIVTRTCTAHGFGLCKGAPDADGNWW